ncbi:MAG: hypothetical protein J6U84_05075 [Bacteroidales bacterium]|jgi:hypothetical protein|nr:hypothetical protein [Bacteroidales bacterium]
MKRILITFLVTLLVSAVVYSQETNKLLLEYKTNFQKNEIEVFVNLVDGKINTKKPFSYYKKGNYENEISKKELRKDFRLKLKSNKKVGKDCYFIQLNGFKDFKINANYTDHSKTTTTFWREGKTNNDIRKITFYYKDKEEKKLDVIRLECKHIPLGNTMYFEFKK